MLRSLVCFLFAEAHLSFSLLNVVSFVSSVGRLQADRVLLKLPHLKSNRWRERFRRVGRLDINTANRQLYILP